MGAQSPPPAPHEQSESSAAAITLPDPASIFLAVAPAVLIAVFPDAPAWVKVVMLEAVVWSTVHWAFTAIRFFRKFTVRRRVLLHIAAAVAAIYPLTIAVDRWSLDHRPHFSAEIGDVAVAQKGADLSNGTPVYFAAVWISVHNTGAPSIVRAWYLNITRRSGEPIYNELTVWPEPIRVYHHGGQKIYRTTYTRDMQIWDRDTVHPIEPGHGDNGLLVFRLYGVYSVENIDLKSVRIWFTDISNKPWQADVPRIRETTTREHNPGEPIPD